jgi:hypothetical protein
MFLTPSDGVAFNAKRSIPARRRRIFWNFDGFRQQKTAVESVRHVVSWLPVFSFCEVAIRDT